VKGVDMDIGTVLVLLGVILAVVSLFVAQRAIVPAAIILVGVGVLIGATALIA
jgi:hypothetical protein